MWRASALKREARSALCRNYWRTVGVCLLAAFFVGGITIGSIHLGLFSPSEIGTEAIQQQADRFAVKSNAQIVDEFLHEGEATPPELWGQPKPTRGVLAALFNSVTKSQSFIFGILNAINQFLFNNQILGGVIILIGTVLGIFYWFFISNIIVVGRNRFFLENRVYSATKIGRLLFPYHVRRGRHTVWVMFLKSLFLYLWSLTIVGGLIKRYSYYMIPYIMAENPETTREEAFLLSRSMMNGQKWRTFLLELSFIGWAILGVLTFGLSNLLFLTPYKQAVMANLYMQLRKTAKEKKLPFAYRLCDVHLEQGTGKTYPYDQYLISVPPSRRFVRIDYCRRYGISSVILLFFTFSFIGWIWEVSLHIFNDGDFVNRGVLHGPWLPIYGTGGVLLLLVLRKFREKPLLTFFLAMLVCGIVEYGTAWFLESTKNLKWWDYSGYFLNLKGRICLEGLIVFGLGGCAFIYVLAPLLDQFYKKIPRRVKIIICSVLLVLFCFDAVYSLISPNTGKGINADYASGSSAQTQTWADDRG